MLHICSAFWLYRESYLLMTNCLLAKYCEVESWDVWSIADLLLNDLTFFFSLFYIFDTWAVDIVYGCVHFCGCMCRTSLFFINQQYLTIATLFIYLFLTIYSFFFLQKTKEALFTILGDLRPNDHFNFVSFSNRLRVWQPGKLVPVTPNSVRDAKKFIYMISPTGGATPYMLFSFCHTMH